MKKELKEKYEFKKQLEEMSVDLKQRIKYMLLAITLFFCIYLYLFISSSENVNQSLICLVFGIITYILRNKLKVRLKVVNELINETEVEIKYLETC
ncbi:hypothetical protein HX088_07315 [Empedobacter sp. 225-1]|uniref:hypothetical protein n=1 Tax=Empedobacter sp. 225-1 TaxID=2746725 RepID=UPI002578A244|nr:hypothetical protein [Empedobacter sp. 225-1]MDM1523074.1 hypothetical protein [Empedobacter sp. 225-1]